MKRTFTTFAVTLAIALAGCAQAAEEQGDVSPRGGFAACLDMFPGAAVPQARSVSVQDLCKSVDGEAIFAIRFDTGRKISAWTAHSLSFAQMERIKSDPAYPNRVDFFAPDRAVPATEQSMEKNYTNTGYNKGHLVRAKDMNWNAEAYRATYLMTNMAPQRGALNSGPWLGMEKDFQDWVFDKKITLWAIAGVYGVAPGMPTLKDRPGNATVPKCFYKIVVAQTDAPGGEKAYKAISAVFVNDDHDRKQKTWGRYLTTLERIEARTGIDFLAGLNIEAQYDADYWGVVMPEMPADCE